MISSNSIIAGNLDSDVIIAGHLNAPTFINRQFIQMKCQQRNMRAKLYCRSNGLTYVYKALHLTAAENT